MSVWQRTTMMTWWQRSPEIHTYYMIQSHRTLDGDDWRCGSELRWSWEEPTTCTIYRWPSHPIPIRTTDLVTHNTVTGGTVVWWAGTARDYDEWLQNIIRNWKPWTRQDVSRSSVTGRLKQDPFVVKRHFTFVIMYVPLCTVPTNHTTSLCGCVPVRDTIYLSFYVFPIIILIIII